MSGSGPPASPPGSPGAQPARFSRRPAWRRITLPASGTGPGGGGGSGGDGSAAAAAGGAQHVAAAGTAGSPALPAAQVPVAAAAPSTAAAAAPAAQAQVPALPAAGGAQRVEAEEEKRCSHCGSQHTSGGWKRHASSGQRLCAACGRYAYKHSGQLPPVSVLQHRPAEPRRKGTKEEMAQRRCLLCGSASPGNGKFACWNRHPLTGAEWLCRPCWGRADYQLKPRKDRRQKRQLGAASGDAGEEEGEEAPQQPRQRRQQRQRQQLRAGEERCSHCGTAHTSYNWRRHPTSGERLCAACGGYASRHGGRLPAVSVLERRPAEPELRGSKEEMAQRRCLQCGSASPGAGKGSHWRRHPLTGAEWLCNPCRSRIYRQLNPRSNRQQKLQRAASSGDAGEEEEEEALEQPQQRRQKQPASPAGGRAADPEPAAKRRRKQPQQPASSGIEQGAAATAVAVPAAASQLLAVAAAPAETGQVLHDLLQQAVQVAAAAASGLTPELAAAFAWLLPLDSNRVRQLLC